jgi:hypothetical protein
VFDLHTHVLDPLADIFPTGHATHAAALVAPLMLYVFAGQLVHTSPFAFVALYVPPAQALHTVPETGPSYPTLQKQASSLPHLRLMFVSS